MGPRASATEVRRPGVILGGGFALLTALVTLSSVAAAPAKPATGAAPALSPMVEAERRTMHEVCGSKCHQVEMFASARKSYSDWHATVQTMIDRGADGTEEQLIEVMDYLFRTQTIIDVNAADPEDLQIILDVPDAQLQAIVARRTKKKFASLADLKSVTGVDAAKLDAKAGFLVFQ